MANEKRLIDANALIAYFEEQYNVAMDDPDHVSGYVMAALRCCIDYFKTMPTVDAVEVVHGQWKFLDIDGWWFDECSICGATTPNRDGSPPDWNYCPNCGAKMDLKGDNHEG